MFTLHGWQTSTPVDLPSRGLVGKTCAWNTVGHPLIVSDLVSTPHFPLSHTALPGGPKVPKRCTNVTRMWKGKEHVGGV